MTPLSLEQTSDFRHGTYWRCHCQCGWSSRDIPFKDPDAALHGGELHRVMCKRFPAAPEIRRVENTWRDGELQ